MTKKTPNLKIVYSRQFIVFSSIILILIAISGCLFFEGQRLESQLTKTTHDVEILNAEVPDPVFKYAPLMVDTGDPAIKELTASLGEPAKIYVFVRDNVEYSEIYDKQRTAIEVLKNRQGDCLGKADLLAALLRAYGYTENEIVVSMGYVNFNGERRHHAWVELNSNGKWIVLDSSGFLGKFEFDRWDMDSFYQAFQAQPYVKFNDKNLHESLGR